MPNGKASYSNPPLRYYLALGDSYTIGQSVSNYERYPVQTVALLRNKGFPIADPQIIATTGWTTSDLLNAIKDIKSQNSYDLVTLLIGVNNQYRGQPPEEYRKEFTELLNYSIQFAGKKPDRVFVLSIPDYSITPFARGSNTAEIARQIDAFNQINLEVSTENNVNYLNITADSRLASSDPSLLAEDSLHFSGKMYQKWANKLAQLMEKVLQ